MRNIGAAIAGGNGNRKQHDFYPTPPEAVHALLPVLSHWPKLVWEPCCGDGSLSRILEGAGFEVHATDLIDHGYGRGGPGYDFLTFRTPPADSIVTNPPFKHASRFISHARSIGIQRMALLLKMTFWNAASRISVFREWQPHVVLPLTWRLDFDGRGAPTMDCMWCIWDGESAGITMFAPLTRPKESPHKCGMTLDKPTGKRL